MNFEKFVRWFGISILILLVDFFSFRVTLPDLISSANTINVVLGMTWAFLLVVGHVVFVAWVYFKEKGEK
jgi:uncharacterized membrane protein YjfL (UPF0719 family)